MRLSRRIVRCAVCGGVVGLCVTSIIGATIAVLELTEVLEFARPILRGILGLG